MNPAPPSAPFEFATASYLTRISAVRADTLAQLRDGLRASSEASIFYHTFQSLGRFHYLTEGFSNDFAQWVLAGCNLPDLAERLSALDIREYLSLADLRADLWRLCGDYCRLHRREAHQEAFEPFYFCESVEITLPVDRRAATLEEFHDALATISTSSFSYHFLTSRLRLHLKTNDFSQWVTEALGRADLAQRIGRIDIYTNTAESARARMLVLLEKERRQ